METLFGKRSILMNIKIKLVTNKKNFFHAIFRFIFWYYFQVIFFIKYWEKNESNMVKVGKQDTFEKYYQLNT